MAAQDERRGPPRTDFADREQQCPNADVCDGAHGLDCVAKGYTPPQHLYECRRVSGFWSCADACPVGYPNVERVPLAQIEPSKFEIELTKVREGERRRFNPAEPPTDPTDRWPFHVGVGSDLSPEARAVVEAHRAFTGYRCDRQGCGAAIAGRTETRAQLHALTARAESQGWQCVHVDGKTLHFCRDHADERYPPKRRHYP